MSEATVSGQHVTTYTHCVICEHLCGLKVTTAGDAIVAIEPDKENPFTWRDFCVKGATADQVRTHPLRLRSVMKRVGDRYVAVPYEEAVGEIGARLKGIIDVHGPDAVAGYLGNPGGFHCGAMMFFSALMDAIGTRNRSYTGSIDQNAHDYVAQHMYGSWWCSLQPDIDQCDCFLLVGTNPAISGMSWGGHSSDGWHRVLRRVHQGADLIMVDPRRTESARKATVHVTPLPEADWAFLLALIRIVSERGWIHRQDCAEAEGVDRLQALAMSRGIDELSERCDVPEATILEVAQRFAQAPTAVCITRTGPAQGRNGTLAEWLGQALNLITGRNDRPGCRYFNPYPVNMLTSGSAWVPNIAEPSRVRKHHPVSGWYSIAELPDEILTLGAGQVRALIMQGGNPVTTGPDGARLDVALATLDLFVAVDLFQRESHRHAHWLIPDSHFLERDELQALVGALHELPFAQTMRAAVARPPGVRHAWEFFRDLAVALGRPLFGGRIDSTPNVLGAELLAAGGAVTFEQIQRAPHGLRFGPRPFGHFRPSLATEDKRVHACPRPLAMLLQQRLAKPIRRADGSEWPFQLISRRRSYMMNSWLVETTAKRVGRKPGDLIEINRHDATQHRLHDGDIVRVRSRVGEVIARVVVSDDIRPGVAVMDHGWGSRFFDPTTGRVASCEGVNRNLLVASDELDPLSLVPRLNGMPVAVVPL